MPEVIWKLPTFMYPFKYSWSNDFYKFLIRKAFLLLLSNGLLFLSLFKETSWNLTVQCLKQIHLNGANLVSIYLRSNPFSSFCVSICFRISKFILRWHIFNLLLVLLMQQKKKSTNMYEVWQLTFHPIMLSIKKMWKVCLIYFLKLYSELDFESELKTRLRRF